MTKGLLLCLLCTAHTSLSFRSFVRPSHNLWSRKLTWLSGSDVNVNAEETSQDFVEDFEDGKTEGFIESFENNTTETETLADPKEVAIKQVEDDLRKQVQDLEALLRSERVALARTKDKLSESGKAGYFIVQAQVNDFLRKTEAKEKERVTNNKKEFVLKMLPVVDALRAAPSIAPADGEIGENMHKGFSNLLSGVVNVITKYGFKEFIPEIGDKLDPVLHKVESVITVEDDKEGEVNEVTYYGLYNIDGSVLRRAGVIGTKRKPVEETETS